MQFFDLFDESHNRRGEHCRFFSKTFVFTSAKSKNFFDKKEQVLFSMRLRRDTTKQHENIVILLFHSSSLYSAKFCMSREGRTEKVFPLLYDSGAALLLFSLLQRGRKIDKHACMAKLKVDLSVYIHMKNRNILKSYLKCFEKVQMGKTEKKILTLFPICNIVITF